MFIKRRRWFIALVQSVLIVGSAVLAWLLRFEFSFPNPGHLFFAVPLLLLFRMVSMKRYGLFHGYWRYAGLNDFEDIIKSVLLGSLGFVVSLRYVIGYKAFPLSIYILEALITAGLLGGLRFASRRVLQQKEAVHRKKKPNAGSGGRVLVVGAGEAAYQLIHELPRHGYVPVGCVDDDTRKLGAKIQGVPVLGTISDIPRGRGEPCGR